MYVKSSSFATRKVKSSVQPEGANRVPKSRKERSKCVCFHFHPCLLNIGSVCFWFIPEQVIRIPLEFLIQTDLLAQSGLTPSWLKSKQNLIGTEPNPFGWLERRSTTDAWNQYSYVHLQGHCLAPAMLCFLPWLSQKNMIFAFIAEINVKQEIVLSCGDS